MHVPRSGRDPAKVSFLLFGLILSSAYGKPNGGFCSINGAFHQHESDCSMFYACESNKLIPFKCPPPLEWSRAKEQCDWPGMAVCDLGPAIVSCDPSTAPPTCPERESSMPTVHLAHQSDCTKFYACAEGVLHLVNCPANLYFNPKLQICDYPRMAGCLCDRLD